MCHQSVELEQSSVLVIVPIDVDIQLLDALDGKFVMRERQLIGIRGEFVGIIQDMGWECGREKNSLDVSRHQSIRISLVAF